MKINRIELLSILKTAAPALSSNKNLVEVMAYFWFDGKTVSAYDDMIGIQVDFEQGEFTGGLQGDKLLGLLENSLAVNVIITVEDKNILRVKAAKTVVDFPLKPIEDWIWNPELPDTKPYKVTEEFLNMISLLLLSVGNGKVMNPEQRGITVVPGKGHSDFYSTDALTLSWMRLKGTVVSDRVVLATPFCEQIKSSVSVGSKLYVDSTDEGGGVYCECSVEIAKDVTVSVLLFGRLILDENPESHDFEAAIRENPITDTAFNVPSKLKGALDRALVFIRAEKMMTIGVGPKIKGDGEMVYLKSAPEDEIDFNDYVDLDSTEHPDISAKVEPQLLRRALDGREKMAVTDSTIILSGPGDFIHIISAN